MNMNEKLQQFGKAMLVSLSLIALGGLFLGFGGAMTTEMTVTALGINWESYSQSFLFSVFSIIKTLGSVIFSNLALLYAAGVAFSLAKHEQGWAAFSAMVAYLTMHASINTLFTLNGLTPDNTTVEYFMSQGITGIEAAKMSALYTVELGYFTYRVGIFGGILTGVTVSFIHNRLYNIKLPLALAFFAGTRSVPVISLIAGSLIGVFFYTVWPALGFMLGSVSSFVHQTGLFGTFVYSALIEILVPFGLHPLLEVPMYWTELGGSMLVDGKVVVGNSNILFAQLASPDTDKLLVRAFQSQYSVVNYAIYPGIALAMYMTSKPENKQYVAALLIPTVVATAVFGITEPILFTFLFIAPWLYFGVYAPLVGLAAVISEFAQVSVYQGNIKDLIPFLFRPEKLNLFPYIWILPLFFALFYFLFRYLILKNDLPTPGRGEEGTEVKLYSKEEYENKKNNNTNPDQELAHQIITHLGGVENISELDNCSSRLRIIVKDPLKVAEDPLWKGVGAMGVVRQGNAVQVIFGPKVVSISVDVRGLLGY